jgi:uncharacterized protein with von Willebrand factor type A (vWA) domain
MNKQRERRIQRLETAFGKEPPSQYLTWPDFVHEHRYMTGFRLLWPNGEGAPALAIREYERIAAEFHRPFAAKDEARKQLELEENKRAEKEAKRREEENLRLAEETKRREEEEMKRREQEAIENREAERKRQEELEKQRREENYRKCLEDLTRCGEESRRPPHVRRSSNSD